MLKTLKQHIYWLDINVSGFREWFNIKKDFEKYSNYCKILKNNNALRAEALHGNIQMFRK